MDNERQGINAFTCIAVRCKLSERTVRDAFSRKAITYRTACRISRNTGIAIAAFRIKEDLRGKNRKGIK